MQPSTKRRKYDASYKLKVIEVAKASNNCAAARIFDVTEKMVRDWRMNEDDLKGMLKEKCAMRRGSLRWPQLEDRVVEWVSVLRQHGYIIIRNKVKAYALNLDKPHGFKDSRATSGWCSRFMNRKNLVMRKKPQITLRLPRKLDH